MPINLPSQYLWLLDEQGPKMLLEFLRLYGTKEVIGTGDNPEILSWAKEIGVERDYRADSIPWCGLFMGVIAKRAGKPVVPQPLWARNWLHWGNEVKEAMLGDVLVYQRPTGGHVGIYIGEDDVCYHTGGGNQGDQVSIVRILKSRCLGIRRPKYTQQPANVRKIVLAVDGDISENEK